MDIPICITKKGTEHSRVIQEGKTTVVYEAPMTNKLTFMALDHTLRDLGKINHWDECTCHNVGTLD